jgi:hypothetical protein
MSQVLHGSAATTAVVRRAIQHSQESLRALAKRYGINQTTVAKWKRRTSIADPPTGPKDAKSTMLSIEEEAIIVAFRRAAARRLPVCASADHPAPNAVVIASLPEAPRLGRLPEVEGDKPEKQKFKRYPIGYFHLDTVDGTDVQLTPKSELSLSLAIHELATNAAKYGALTATGGRMAAVGDRPPTAWSCPGPRLEGRSWSSPNGVASDRRLSNTRCRWRHAAVRSCVFADRTKEAVHRPDVHCLIGAFGSGQFVEE